MFKKTLTIGIPAYNEANNIGNVIRDIFNQKQLNYQLTKIIVSSDGSTDNTVKIVRSFKNKYIEIIDNKNRKGISRGLNQILAKTNTDLFVILDGDIRLQDPQFVSKLISPILSGIADLTSAVIVPSNVNTFFTRTLNSSVMLKKSVFANFLQGNNVYTCYGPARAFSKRLYTQLNFPKLPGNDMYSYLKCIKLGYKFIRLLEPEVYYKLPTNFADHIKQSTRFLQAIDYHSAEFEESFMQHEFKVPLAVYLNTLPITLKIFLQMPLETLVYLITLFYSKFNSYHIDKISDAWPIAVSSK